MYSFILAIKKLPWNVFAMVLLIHLGVLWWLLEGYVDQNADIYPEPIFVTLEAIEALPSESSIPSAIDEPAKDYQVGDQSERLK